MAQTIFDRSQLLWGEENQAKLAQAKVVLLGVGGLGAAVAQVLVRAGVGKIALVDQKRLDLPDLGRQLLYTQEDLGKTKVQAAKEKILKINPNCQVQTFCQNINLMKKLPSADLFVDCLDNFATRRNLWAKLPEQKYLLHCGVQGYQGQLITLQKGRTVELTSLLATGENSVQKIAIAPQTVMLAGALAGDEVICVLQGKPKLLGKILQFDMKNHRFVSFVI